MVLTSASRPLARSLGPIASRSRGLSSLASASAVPSLRSSSSRLGGVTSRQAAANSSALPGSICRSKLGPTMSIRSLTGFPREKVKVLMVLYDGGKHAEEVSYPVFPDFDPNPNLPILRRPTAVLVASTGPRDNQANCPRTSAPTSPHSLPQHANSQAGLKGARCAIRCHAILRTTKDSQLSCGPVDWLQDCGVAFLEESRGRRRFWTIYRTLDPILDAPGNPAISGQSCVGVRWTSIAWTSGSIPCVCDPLRRAARERVTQERATHTQRESSSWRNAGCLFGEAAAASRRGLGKRCAAR